ncbi:MAG: DUF4271 domain-containing protein [Prevotellaceae bacterium]|nr:DUF4271 domain-containing protein [Prevotellaceae bacterium]
MISDSLKNNIVENAGDLYIPAESGIFGKNSVVYYKTAEISEIKPINHSDNFVKSGIAVSLCIYFLLILFILKERISSISKMFDDYQFTKKQYEESSRISSINTTYIVMFTIMVVSVQFFLMNDYQEYKLLIVSFLALFGIFIIQSVVLKLVTFVCKSEDILGEVNLNRKLYLSILGMILLPMTVLALLYEGSNIEKIALIISRAIFCSLILFMIFRLRRIFSEAKVSYFFFFLYLCTFEISPYLALFIVFESIN